MSTKWFYNMARNGIKKWLDEYVPKNKGRKIAKWFIRRKINSYQYRFGYWNAKNGSIGPSTVVRNK